MFALASPISIWPFHRKTVWQMPHFMNHASLQQHLHDIEPDFYLRILEQPQVVQRSARQPAAPLGLYRRGRARPIFRGACFDFDKHQAILIAKDQIHFSPFRTEVRCEKLQAIPFQVAFGGALAEFAMAQMQRLFCGTPPRSHTLNNARWLHGFL